MNKLPEKTIRQFGLWDSPVSPRSVSRSRRLDAARWDCDGQTLVWLEGRSGQGILVVQNRGNNAPHDLTGDMNVRAEVGYGGGDFTVHGGKAYFVQHETGRIYQQPLVAGLAKPITPKFGKASSPVVSPDGRWVAYVHHDEEKIDRIAVVDSEGTQWPRILTSGHDFYMQPRWSPDGRHLAWIAWDHPNMPWDGTTLQMAAVAQKEGQLPLLEKPRDLAGDADTAVFQPEFTPDSQHVLFVTDESGWGRIASRNIETGQHEWLTQDGDEYATPAWLHDLRTFAVTHDGQYVIAARNEAGFHRIVRIDRATGEATAIDALAEYTEVAQITAAASSDAIAFVGSSATTPPRLVRFDLRTEQSRIVARSTGETFRKEGLSKCEAVSWETTGQEKAHGLFYPPASERFEGRGKPPLMVLVHGGPTSQARAGWKAEAQFFATRGYAVLFVNYRGSTGYGRDYMLRLRGNWGICDVEDAISGARYLCETARADPHRTIIMGGSAGGFTVLQAMVQHPKFFAAGVNLFGVADQFRLAAGTHKFESRYLDTMLGTLPEASPVYRERSPIVHADRICRPLAIFQGDVDRVVPREQSDSIAEALKRNGTPHVYHVYEGEGHGWRKQKTIEHYYKAVEEFLRHHVIFT